MSDQNPTQKAPPIPVMVPRCPSCGGELNGVNLAGLKLPIPGPDGKPVKFLNFLVPCCPNIECSVALSVQFTGEEAAPAPGAAAGLWTPPGSH